MIPILDRIGKGAFMFYMFFVVISFVIGVAYQIGGVEPPSIARQYGQLPQIKANVTLANQTYDIAVEYLRNTGMVAFLSLQAVANTLSYILNAVINMGGFFASLAHTLFNETPLHGPAVTFAIIVGYAIQGLAWMWAIFSLTRLFARGE
jgi:hypothetical protein